MFKLVISDDDGHTTVVPLLRDPVTIGREPGNTIRLTERNVSRAHARMIKRNGSYFIEDLGSYNGVSVNGRRIDDRAELRAGDRVSIGDYELALQSDTTASPSRPPVREPESGPPPRLVVLGEPAAGAEFTLTKPALRIGRDERLDIWINHKSISHEHAEVQVSGAKVTVYDLDSANGMRVNGIRASRALLETGDILQLGDVRFRFLAAQGMHSLVPDPEEPVEPAPSWVLKKPVIAGLVLVALAVFVTGSFLVTMRRTPVGEHSPNAQPLHSSTQTSAAPGAASPGGPSLDVPTAAKSQSSPVDEPQEWERELVRARRALARERFDRAYAIANELPTDSVLRETPEFREIRYRYVQSHILDGERALREGNARGAREEAELVLGIDGLTPKQRQEARRLLRRSRGGQSPRIVD